MDIEKNNWKEGSYRRPLQKCLQDTLLEWINARKKSWKSEYGLYEVVNDINDCITIEPEMTKKTLYLTLEDYAEELRKHIKGIEGGRKTVAIIETLHGMVDDMNDISKEVTAIVCTEDFIERVVSSGERLHYLTLFLGLLEKFPLEQKVKDFLRLVSRCYTSGFDAECMILCRSAMETAFKNKISYETCQKYRRICKRDTKGDIKLEERIDAAYNEKLISPEILKKANRIRIRVNKILHETPKLVENTLGTIVDTVRIIIILSKGHDPFTPPKWLKDL